MKKLSIILSIWFVIFLHNTELFAGKIFLKDGREIESKTMWEEEDVIKYQKFGATVSVSKDQIEKAVFDDGQFYSNIELSWQGFDPSIETKKNTWSRITGRDVKVGNSFYRYEYGEGTVKRGFLYKDNVLIGIYENKTRLPDEEISKHINRAKKTKEFKKEFKNNVYKVLKSKISEAITLFAIGKMHQENENFVEAIRYYDKAQDLFAFPPDIEKWQEYNELIISGDDHKRRGQYKKSELLFSKAIKIFPDEKALRKSSDKTLKNYGNRINNLIADIQLNRGLCWLKKGKISRARLEYFSLTDTADQTKHQTENSKKLRTKLKVAEARKLTVKDDYQKFKLESNMTYTKSGSIKYSDDINHFNRSCYCQVKNKRTEFLGVDFLRISVREWSKIRSGKGTQYDKFVWAREKLDKLLAEPSFSKKHHEYREARKLVYNILYCMSEGCTIYNYKNSEFVNDASKALTISKLFNNDYESLRNIKQKRSKMQFEQIAASQIQQPIANKNQLLMQAKNAQSENNFYDAVRYYSNFLQVYDDNIEALLGRGDCYFRIFEKEREKRSKEFNDYAGFAIADYIKAINLGETTGAAYIKLGALYWVSGKKDNNAPINTWNKVINLNMKEAPQAYYRIALYYNWYKHGVKAHKYMKEAARLGYPEAVKIIEEDMFWAIKR